MKSYTKVLWEFVSNVCHQHLIKRTEVWCLPMQRLGARYLGYLGKLFRKAELWRSVPSRPKSKSRVSKSLDSRHLTFLRLHKIPRSSPLDLL